jgi:hypothetical protein
MTIVTKANNMASTSNTQKPSETVCSQILVREFMSGIGSCKANTVLLIALYTELFLYRLIHLALLTSDALSTSIYLSFVFLYAILCLSGVNMWDVPN